MKSETKKRRGTKGGHPRSQAHRQCPLQSKRQVGKDLVSQTLPHSVLSAGSLSSGLRKSPSISQLPLRDPEIKGEPFGAMTEHRPKRGNQKVKRSIALGKCDLRDALPIRQPKNTPCLMCLEISQVRKKSKSPGLALGRREDSRQRGLVAAAHSIAAGGLERIRGLKDVPPGKWSIRRLGGTQHRLMGTVPNKKQLRSE